MSVSRGTSVRLVCARCGQPRNANSPWCRRCVRVCTRNPIRLDNPPGILERFVTWILRGGRND